MFYYTAYSLNIASEILLPGFLKREGGRTNVTVSKVDSALSTDYQSSRIIADRVGKDTIIYTCPYGGLKYEIRYGKEVIVRSGKKNQSDLVRLPLYGFAIATILHQNNYFVLHASAVEIQGKAVVVIGGKAQGKSTLITALVNRGHRLISDDVTALTVRAGKIVALPGIPCIKVWPDTLLSLGIDPQKHPQLYTDSIKRNYFVVAGAYCQSERELGAILVLDHDELLELHTLGAIEKMLWLSGGWYCARFQDTFTSKEKRRMFAICSYFARRVKMAKLKRPSDLDLLGRTCDLVQSYITAD